MALCAIGTVLLGTAGCAGSSYMGISLAPGQTTSEVQLLARRAQAGDKQAQLDLGIRFEEGNGVPQDWKRAISLYHQAATDSGGATWVYAPSPGNGAPARVIGVDNETGQLGLEEARRRLEIVIQRQDDK